MCSLMTLCDQRGHDRNGAVCSSWEARKRSTRTALLQENVLNESAMMVPETQQRTQTALADLQSYLVRCAEC